ncbi:crotonobetainyl-CoA--carnitine CoA-transferase [Flavobacterium sp.]|uniref:crotonobetainyl-CoA--carnitine CoA-transferase n=2 Tax=Flavobacterium sp. TaxID=239 RepID=UPI004047D514
MAIEIKSIASSVELENRNKLNHLFKNCPIPENERLTNSGLFVKRQDLTKQLFFNDLYSKIVDVHGVIMEFGVRWGQNLVTLNNLRGIHEPFNYSRKIIGFDTFSGFENVSEKDGNHEIIKKGAFSVTEEYEKYLEEVLDYHEKECPVSHIKKNILIKGDAVVMLKQYLENHPETIIAFAYFDFDVYEPTKKCLELIQPYLTKGSIIGFDELNDPQFPGETVALRETLGINNVAVKRSKYSGIQSYFEF